jgi:surface carbohydrate biosynthesis protein
LKSFFQFLGRAYKYFRGTKRVWRKPPRADLLIIDRGTASPLDEMFAHHNPHIMDIRGESVNMLALLRAVPKIHLGAVAYLEAYIDFVKPKLILSRTDNNPTLWQLKRRPNSTYKVALIQNGWRLTIKAEIPLLLDKRGQCGVWWIDELFAFGAAWTSQISKHAKFGVHHVGSYILNNFLPTKNSNSSSQKISLVSIFRPGSQFKEKDFMNFIGLKKAFHKRELSLSIISNSTKESHFSKEVEYYEFVIPGINKILYPRSSFGSYRHLLNGGIVLSDASTLGYESLAMGLRTGFVAIREESRVTDRFGLPLEFGEKGPFWTNDPSEEEIGRILDYLLTVSDEQWERDSGWIRDQLMVHDYGNTKIRAYVEGVLTGSLKSN